MKSWKYQRQGKEHVAFGTIQHEFGFSYFHWCLSNGVGFILIQISKSDQILVIAAGGSGLKPAQSRYSTYDLKLSTTVFAIKKLQDYMSGCLKFTIYTNHKALNKFEDTDISTVASCGTMRALEFILSHNVEIRYKQWKELGCRLLKPSNTHVNRGSALSEIPMCPDPSCQTHAHQYLIFWQQDFWH